VRAQTFPSWQNGRCRLEQKHKLIFCPFLQNQEVTEAIRKVAETFKCNPVEGVLSHQMKRFVIDGTNVIINKETPDQQVDEVSFEEYDVYCFDIMVSTGEGKVSFADIPAS